MGLQLAHVDDDNQSGNYWHAHSVSLGKFKDKACVITAALYKDKATRDGAAPNALMCVKEYALTSAEFDAHFLLPDLDLVNQNLFTQAYEYLKTLDGTDVNGVDFTAATDVPVGGGAD